MTQIKVAKKPGGVLFSDFSVVLCVCVCVGFAFAGFCFQASTKEERKEARTKTIGKGGRKERRHAGGTLTLAPFIKNPNPKP